MAAHPMSGVGQNENGQLASDNSSTVQEDRAKIL
jgi:hypothetical protein